MALSESTGRTEKWVRKQRPCKGLFSAWFTPICSPNYQFSAPHLSVYVQFSSVLCVLFHLEDGSGWFLQNVSKDLSDYTASHIRKRQFVATDVKTSNVTCGNLYLIFINKHNSYTGLSWVPGKQLSPVMLHRHAVRGSWCAWIAWLSLSWGLRFQLRLKTIKWRRTKWAGCIARMEEQCTEVIVIKPEGKRLLGTSRRK